MILSLTIVWCVFVNVQANSGSVLLENTSVENNGLDLAGIDTKNAPYYLKPAIEEENFIERIVKYDTPNNLNVVGYKTLNGNEVINIYPHAVKYLKNNALFDKDISLQTINSAEMEKQGYLLKNTSNDIELYLPKDISETGSLLKRGDGLITLQPIEKKVSGIINKTNEAEVVYAGVFGGETDLVLTSNYDGMGISIVEVQPTGDLELSFNIGVTGYLLEQDSDNVIWVKTTQSSEVVYRIPPVIAEDGFGNVAICDMALIQTDDEQYTLSATLANEDVAVFGENVLTLSTSISDAVTVPVIQDAPVYDDFSINMGSYKYAIVGNSSNFGVGRLYTKFDLSSLANAGIDYDQVISAHYHLPFNSDTNTVYEKKLEAYLVKEEWDESTITWDNKPNYLNEVLCVVNSLWDYEEMSDDTSAKSDFYITAAVQGWLQGVSNNGIVIKERDDTGYVSYAMRENSNHTPYLSVVVTSEESPMEGSGITEGVYYIKSKINNMFITASGTTVVQKNLLSNPASQLWILDYIGNGDYKLSPVSASTNFMQATTNISLSTANSTRSRWKIRRNWDGSYSLLSKISNYRKCASIGVNYSAENQSLIYSDDSMGLRKYDDFTLIPNEKGTASVFGFTADFSLDEGIDTLSYAIKSASELQNLGYDIVDEDGISCPFIDSATSDAYDKLTSSSVFVFFGHGLPGCIYFGSDGSYNCISGSPLNQPPFEELDLQSLSSNSLYKQVLTLYGSCLTARDFSTVEMDNSLIGMTYFKGSHYVIAFTNEVQTISMGFFSNTFYDSLTDGCTVYEALNNMNQQIEDYINIDNDVGIDEWFYETMLYRYCLGDNSLVYNLPEYAGNS